MKLSHGRSLLQSFSESKGLKHLQYCDMCQPVFLFLKHVPQACSSKVQTQRRCYKVSWVANCSPRVLLREYVGQSTRVLGLCAYTKIVWTHSKLVCSSYLSESCHVLVHGHPDGIVFAQWNSEQTIQMIATKPMLAIPCALCNWSLHPWPLKPANLQPQHLIAGPNKL